MAPGMAPAPAPAGADGGSSFARALASNAVKERDAALGALGRWLASRAAVEDADLLKLWKGLFYAMWHADKAPVQARRGRGAAGGGVRASTAARARAPR